MNFNAVEDRLKQAVIDANFGLPVVWPNGPLVDAGTRPRLEIGVVPATRISDLSGAAIQENGLLNITVVVESGTSTTYANTKASEISSYFAAAGALTFNGGKVVVVEVPFSSGGFKDGAEWRVPVVIRYRASTA